MKGLGTAIFICYTQKYYLHVEGHCVAVLHSGVYFEKKMWGVLEKVIVQLF